MKTYPSRNRLAMKEAIILDVADWKKLEDDLEIRKARKKMRMLYAHLYMYNYKLEEINNAGGHIEKPIPLPEVRNRKGDEDFVYF